MILPRYRGPGRRPPGLRLGAAGSKGTKAGAIMGSEGVIVMDDATCMVDLARSSVDFTESESWGKCVPCRVGTKRMLDILDRITRGEGGIEDLERQETRARTIKKTSLCGLGQTAPPVSLLAVCLQR